MKITKKILYLFFFGLIIVITVYAWPRVPIITGFAAKGMCSGVFVGHRTPEDIEARELSFFPISLAGTKVNYDDSTVTASLWGLARRKAVYRRGLGCALVADFPIEIVKSMTVTPPPLPFRADTVAWPLGDITPATLPAGVDKKKLDELLQEALDPAGAEPVKKTLAVVVVWKDTIIGEAYAPGITRETPLLGWSMTKSLINAFTGLRVKEGKLSLDEPAPIPPWQEDERKKITLNHLMHMTSGLEWVENYFDNSDVTRMLYVYGDMANYAAGRPAAVPPDSVWYYSSGTTNIISGILRHTFASDKDYHRYPYEKLFYRTGMLHALMEADASGTFVGSSYSYATARDWARFGLLYLHDGIFCGDTILPAGWVEYTRQEAPRSGGEYGAQWWLNKNKNMPDVPEDAFLCDGFQGQRVFVIPSHDLVVVRLGWSMKDFDMNRFLADILATLEE
jgi:CubicO group peptidase (beta-lactamase class C family)